MILSDEQKAIVEAPVDEYTVVMAAAAAGKTATLTERLRYVLNYGIEPSKIVALTFTNNAAAEMRDRLGEDFREGMFMGTIHSYANMLLNLKGFDTSRIRLEEEFDELFDMIEEHPEVLKDVDYLLCDESQDLNPRQFDFISSVIQPKGCLIVGDVRQSIYSFRGAEPKLLTGLMKSDDYEIRELTQNYRNGKSIIYFSNSIIKKMKNVPNTEVKPMREIEGTIQKIGNFEIISTIMNDKTKNWKDWAVLCRTNKKVDSIMYLLEKREIPCITFRQAQGDLTELKKKMDQNAVKVLTIHSAKGLEFNKVIVCDIYTKGQENLRLNYVAVTRAKDELYLCI